METSLKENIVKCVEKDIQFSGPAGTFDNVQFLLHNVGQRALNKKYPVLKKQLDSLDTDSLFDNTNTQAASELKLKIDTIVGIFNYKKGLAEAAKKREELRAKKDRLVALKERKEDEALENLSAEEIDKLIAETEV